MTNVLLLNKISKAGLAKLSAEKYACATDAVDPDAILVRSADMKSMEFGKKLLCIGRAGAGVNNIPVDRCTDEGIVVFNTPGANSNAVKELAVCALFLGSRRVVEGIEWVKTLKDKGDDVPALVEKGKSAYAGPEIAGKTLGVIGLGAIGAKLADAAVDLGMTVYGYDPFLTVDAAWNLSRHVVHAKSEDEIYANCDYISIHIPYNPETANKFNAAAFDKMKDGVRIINLARGELVSTDDLLAAIASGKVASYVTDFPNAKIIGEPGVVCIPHLAASSPESEENCAIMAAREVREYVEHGSIRNSVNFPNVEVAFDSGNLLCLIHKNIPNMINSITNACSHAGINIENMINKSKRDNAYTVIHTNDSIPESVISEIESLEGIIRVRVIEK